ncbi:MAG: hypothetical protein JW814_00540, partial [Candidatus Krumholzibacteriota bacterium]|nr:hypothetical protein [Candidatus Krumholzibacteriota bacterium]
MFLRKIFLSILSAVLLFALSPAGQLEAAVAEEEVIEGLLPGSGAIAGWERDGEMISYMADDLWEYINGSAENFLAYNFQKVVAQHYVNGAGGEIKVEIYAHETPLMAFGIYSRYRTAESRFSDTGNESFGDDYSLHFWKGKYYVKISAYDEGNSSIEAFAQQVADRISEAGAVPEEIELLRVDGLSEKSITYLTGGVLGSGELPPAFTADYDI